MGLERVTRDMEPYIRTKLNKFPVIKFQLIWPILSFCDIYLQNLPLF